MGALLYFGLKFLPTLSGVISDYSNFGTNCNRRGRAPSPTVFSGCSWDFSLACLSGC